jgi:hypothetical protein
MRLLDFAANIYSQNGEDGILAKMLDLLPVRDGWCVEFGAWDGIYFSNTRNLIEKRGYSAILIEPNQERFADLVKNYSGNSSVITLRHFVGITRDDNLDHILADKPIPKDFDVLTIDIEGNDYHAWDAMSVFTPKIVHIPFNPSIPTEVDFTQRPDPNVSQGPSLLALTQLASRKGYELTCVNRNSAFFVRSKYFPLFGISNNDPRVLREDFSAITYIFTGYDGSICISGRDLLLHHRDVRISRRLRQLPRGFRTYPHNWGWLTHFCYKFYWRFVRMLGRA